MLLSWLPVRPPQEGTPFKGVNAGGGKYNEQPSRGLLNPRPEGSEQEEGRSETRGATMRRLEKVPG